MGLFKIAVISFSLLVVSSAVSAAPQNSTEIANQLRTSFMKQMDALNQNNIPKFISYIHTKSPVYQQTKVTMKQLASLYKLKYVMISFKYVASDFDFQIVRIKQKTSKVSGPEFKNNILDAYHVFKKEGNDWKVWQTTILDVQYL